jgi:Cu-Zn family superoxide dismutase
VRFVDGEGGLYIQPSLDGLTAGAHGFHIHAKPSCAATADKSGKLTPGGAAGGHFDPGNVKGHRGPHGRGHLGDLPRLIAGPSGDTGGWLLAPRLKVADIRGKSVIVHAGGDNYADKPQPLGGGGARFACGVIE